MKEIIDKIRYRLANNHIAHREAHKDQYISIDCIGVVRLERY